MIEIGGRPMIWHIMKLYSHYGVNNFVICCGYRGYMIKEYFANYFLHTSDVTLDLAENSMSVHHSHAEPWQVTLVDTGEETLTGGRLRRVRSFLDDNESFCFTYGDGVSNVDIGALVRFHEAHGAFATVTGVEPLGRYGALISEADIVTGFVEKPRGEAGWINGGFFVLSPKVIDYIDGDTTSWEVGPLERLAEERQLRVFRHHGFWHAMDTLRDKNVLEDLWRSGCAPWKIW